MINSKFAICNIFSILIIPFSVYAAVKSCRKSILIEHPKGYRQQDLKTSLQLRQLHWRYFGILCNNLPKMYLLNVGFLLFIVSCAPSSRALPASCQTDWKIDWDHQMSEVSNFEPFSNPGEILPGVSVNDTLRFIGMFWNTPSWEQFMGQVCIHYGPLVYALYPEQKIRSECDMIVSSLQKGQMSDIFGKCVSYWDQIGFENMVRGLIGQSDQCVLYGMVRNSPNLDSSTCHLDPLSTIYATDPLQKISLLAFKILDWLGPSPFSGDWFGACSALRILLNDSIDEILHQIKNLLKYPVADTLEYLNHIDVCYGDNAEVVLFLDGDLGICDFLSGEPSRKEYLEKSEELIDISLSVNVNVETCTDVIAKYISSYDPYGDIFYVMTGRNLTSEINRKKLCDELASAFSDNSPYVPTPYVFSVGNVTQLSELIFAEEGQLLPNFNFINYANVLGAVLRSNTLSTGLVVLCDVFESFLLQFEPSVQSMCTALRRADADTVEKTCIALSPISENFHPSLRKLTFPYVVVTGVDLARKLFQLSEISRDHVCYALDEYFHSSNNLQSMIRFALDGYLTEILPIVEKICKDYDAVLVYLQNNMHHLSRNEFQKKVQIYTDFILKHMGFSDRTQLCQTIIAGVDSSSGRSKTALIDSMEKQLLLFLTNSQRCKKTAQSAQSIIAELNVESEFSKLFTQHTGYKTLSSACESVNAFFDPGLCTGKGTISEISGLVTALAVLVSYFMRVMYA